MTKLGVSSVRVCEVLSVMGYHLVLEVQPNIKTQCFVKNSERLTTAEVAVGDFGALLISKSTSTEPGGLQWQG